MTFDNFADWVIDRDLPREYEALLAENPGKPVLFADLVKRAERKIYGDYHTPLSPELDLRLKQEVRRRLREYRGKPR